MGTKIRNDSSIAVKLNRFNAQKISGSSDIKFNYVEIDTADEILNPGDICDYEFVIYWDSSSVNQDISDVKFEIELNYEQYVKKSNATPAHSHNGIKVTAIGQNAFKNNKKIKSVTLSKYIRVTNDNCFSGCSNLEKIIIYSEDLNIEGENFLPCESLKEFIVNEGNRSYKTVDGVLYSLDGTKLIRYPQAKEDKEFVVPETVTEICTRGIDQNQYLEKIVIPENVKIIGDYAVALLPKLTSLTVNAETINGKAAFCDNYYVTELKIGNNVKEMNGADGVLRKCGQKNSTNIIIIYDGTKAEWNQIKKISAWRANSKITAVQCTDGTISP